MLAVCLAASVLSIVPSTAQEAPADEPWVRPSNDESSPAGPAVAAAEAGLAMVTDPLGGPAAESLGGPAVISNGVVQLGVNPSGALIVPNAGAPSAGVGTTDVGLRYLPENTDVLAPGCWCEGWGVGDPNSGVSGSAYNSGVTGLTPIAFEATASSAVSTVQVGSTFLVRHSFSPAAGADNTYAIEVTVENIDTVSRGVRYRRVMDWDVEPTAFDEYVTIAGSSPRLHTVTNDGFASPDPLDPATDMGVRGAVTDAYPPVATDPDHGALFDFDFGTLKPGRSTTFTLYYGATSTETSALAQLREVDAETYSLAQPNTSSGPTLGEPNTFYFGFGSGLVGGPLLSRETLGGGSPSEPNARNAQCNRGMPVNCTTGNFWHSFMDMAVPGRGIELRLDRTYNSLGAASRAGRFGYGWSSPYDMRATTDPLSGDVTVREENGAEIVFSPDGSGGFEAPPRVRARLEPTQDGGLRLTRYDGHEFAFDQGGRLVTQRDRNGYTNTLAYDGDGDLVSVTDPAGRSITFNADAAGRVTSATDPAGRTVEYTYDAAGDLVSAADVAGGVTAFDYDASHQVVTMTDPRGGVVANTYDGTGRVTSQTDRDGGVTTFEYGDSTTTITDPSGDVTIDRYVEGVLVAVTKGAGTPEEATRRYSYDRAAVAPVRVTDANGHTTTLAYDASGNLTERTDPLGRTSRFTWSPANDLLSATEPKTYGTTAATTTFTYDGAGNPTSVSTPLIADSGAVVATKTTTYHYDDPAHPGDVTSITDPLGKNWALEWDADGNLVSETSPPTGDNPAGNKTIRAYNAIGWVTSVVSPNGTAESDADRFRTTLEYDPRGLVTETRDPLWDPAFPDDHRNVRHYDPNGNVDWALDGVGNRTDFVYDAADRLIRVERPDGSVVRSEYWPDGLVRRQIDGAEQVTTYEYDALDRVVATRTPPAAGAPAGRLTRYRYDASGNLVEKQDHEGDCTAAPNQRCTTYSYDEADQLVGIDYSDGDTPDVEDITYDANGQRVAMTDGTGRSTWTWDSLHRLVSHTSGAGKTVGYQWDLRDQLTAIDYPDGAGTVTRTYDDAGRWTAVTDWLGHTTEFDYDANSNLTNHLYPNGIETEQLFDEVDRLYDIYNTDPPFGHAGWVYGRDGAGRVSDQVFGPPEEPSSFSYTELGQLDDVDSADYDYDPADNLTKLLDGTRQTFTPANELEAVVSPVSFVAKAEAADGIGTQKSVTATLPAPAAPLDQILVATNTQANVRVDPPAGFTQVGTYYNEGGQMLIVWRRTAAGGEQQVTVGYPDAGPANAQSKSVIVLQYRNVDPDNPIDEVAVGTTASTTASPTTVTAPSVTASRPNGQAVLFEAARGLNPGPGTWTPPSGMTTRATSTASPIDNVLAAADQPLPTAGATGPRVATYSAPLTGLIGALMVLRPAATTYGYDALGNRTSISEPGQPTINLGYNQANRLTAYRDTATYTYDGDGLRASKTVGAAAQQFVWDRSGGLPLLLVDGAGYYVYGPGGRPLQQITAAPPITLTGTAVAADGVGNQATLTATLPAAAAARDQILAATVLVDSRRAVPPTGYTTVGTYPAPNGNKLIIFRKTAAGGERLIRVSYPDDSPTSLGQKALAVAVYRNVDPDSPIDAGSSAATEAGATPTSLTVPAVTATGPGEQLVLFLAAQGLNPTPGTWSTPPGMTKRATITTGLDTALDIDDQKLAGPGSTGSRTASYSAPLSQLMGAMFALRPAPTPVLYYHHDQLGSVRELSNTYGEVVATYTYDPYGRPIETTGTSANPFGFAGEYTDSESGLIYLRARYYDPSTAQFLTRDPIEAITREPYGYAGNDPINRIDPTGLGECGRSWTSPGDWVDCAADAGGEAKDDFVDDVTDWSPRGVAEKVVGYTTGTLAGVGCVLLGGNLVCIPVAYAAKRGGKALGGWLFDQTGRANEWGPLNTFDWPTGLSWPTLVDTAGAAVPYCGDDAKR